MLTLLWFQVILVFGGIAVKLERKVLQMERSRRNMVRSVTRIIVENPILHRTVTELYRRYRRFVEREIWLNDRYDD